MRTNFLGCHGLSADILDELFGNNFTADSVDVATLHPNRTGISVRNNLFSKIEEISSVEYYCITT